MSTTKPTKKPTTRKPATKRKPAVNTRKKPQAPSTFSRATRYTLWTLLALLAAILIYFISRVIIDNAFNIKARFGHITYPAGTVRGIDISHYQHEIDWDRLRNADIDGVPVSFALIKATEGTSIIDEYFNQNFYQARQNNIHRGAYHFLTTSSDPVAQARHFCKIVQLETGDIRPILDVERRDKLTPAQLRQHVLAWMNYVEAHYGTTPILYTSYKFRTDYLNTPEFDRYPLWIAHYYVERLRYKGQWVIWQHTDRGTVDGIEGHVDLNVFNGTHEDMEEMISLP